MLPVCLFAVAVAVSCGTSFRVDDDDDDLDDDDDDDDNEVNDDDDDGNEDDEGESCRWDSNPRLRRDWCLKPAP
ncbi:unnamed protein product [Parnassius mnemosyne]|uniref:Secreted protein n=1 Tax=Parnassius mnemosyne TaxID=213953 RepID=A0AAV1LN07_9NEOP